MDIMDEIRLRAYAKVNLGLDVLRRREDGYHDVRMIMQNINLFDKLTIKKKKEAEDMAESFILLLSFSFNIPRGLLLLVHFSQQNRKNI